ncbi:MAG: DegT/DnrJ/EryC1/StrS family aminotransferase [Gammaproteobacteria bacterium]
MPLASARVDIERRIRAVLDHGRYLHGPEVETLEQRLAEYTGAHHAVAFASGTDALLAALMALGVGPGDEVVTTPLSFVATAEAIRLTGARPVFCDVEPDTLLIDPKRLEAAIGPATRAVVPVDLYGQCADYEAIDAVVRRHRIAVVADAAQSFGARSRGRGAGSMGTIAVPSFHPSMPLAACGDAGAAFTDDDALAERLREVRNHGRDRSQRCVRLGLNARLDALQCAVLIARLQHFDAELQRRRAIAEAYDELLKPPVRKLALKRWNASRWSRYVVRVPYRDAVREALRAAGIDTDVHYPRVLYHEPPFAGEAHCPNAETAAADVLSLPMHAQLSLEAQTRIAAALADAIRLQEDAAGSPSAPGSREPE